MSAKEMKLIMRTLGQDMSEEDIEEMMKQIDPECGGEMDFAGFLKMMTKKLKEQEAEMEEELLEAFKTFDADGKDYFNINDMKDFMEKYGEKVTD